eukprot:ANDGO_05833.mRNA.1 Transcription initiation factor TFIID subunit 12b
MSDEVASVPHILDRPKLQNLLEQLSQYHTLEPAVETALLEIADDFIDSVVSGASSLARHRNSSTLEVKDLSLHLEKNWGIRVPGVSVLGSDGDKLYAAPRFNTEMHRQRMMLKEKAEIDRLEQERKARSMQPGKSH